MYDELTLEEDAEARDMQRLITTGTCWHLEGAAGRAAMSLIEAGLCVLPTESHRDYWGNLVPSRDLLEPGSIGTLEYARERFPDRDPLGDSPESVETI